MTKMRCRVKSQSVTGRTESSQAKPWHPWSQSLPEGQRQWRRRGGPGRDDQFSSLCPRDPCITKLGRTGQGVRGREVHYLGPATQGQTSVGEWERAPN